MGLSRIVAVASAHVGAVARLGAGLFARQRGRDPELPLELFEYESCPFCRRVREALTELDLDVVIYPCPRGGERYRSVVRERGGDEQFPYLVDPNTGASMYESSEIIRYLYATYGEGRPSLRLAKPVAVATGAISSAVRGRRGLVARSSRPPDKRLELYAFEASPYCRLAREALCELEIPYLLHNMGKGSGHRAAFRARYGKQRFPFLVDPNTGVEMGESADIVAYLNQTYGGSAVRPESNA